MTPFCESLGDIYILCAIFISYKFEGLFMQKKNKIGFIGQGWIGKNYADDFESRGFDVIRYSLDPLYVKNKDKISNCKIVFVAVPTPTTPKGFDDSILKEAIKVTGKDSTVVIKSTMPVGKTIEIQNIYKDRFIMHSPEFLVEATARFDASNPERNIIGIPQKTKTYITRAKKVLSVLPKAPYTKICSSNEAELIKYAHNVHGYIQIIFTNMLFDLASKSNMDWQTLQESFKADRMMCHYYLNPVHKSGRGAGGHCFVKDFEAFVDMYNSLNDSFGTKILESVRDKNLTLLLGTKKDMDIVEGVYSKNKIQKILKSKKS